MFVATNQVIFSQNRIFSKPYRVVVAKSDQTLMMAKTQSFNISARWKGDKRNILISHIISLQMWKMQTLMVQKIQTCTCHRSSLQTLSSPLTILH